VPAGSSKKLLERIAASEYALLRSRQMPYDSEEFEDMMRGSIRRADELVRLLAEHLRES
jgi:hypothetical protein